MSRSYHRVDPETEAVLAVKESRQAASVSADNIVRRRHGRPIAIWLLDRTLRPGSVLEDAAGTLIAEYDNGRWRR